METVVLTVLGLLQGLLSQIGTNTGAVNQILTALIQIVPIVVNLSLPIVNSVKAVISALQTSANLTDDQITTLLALSADLDAAWQNAVTAYNSSRNIPPVAVAAAPEAEASLFNRAVPGGVILPTS